MGFHGHKILSDNKPLSRYKKHKMKGIAPLLMLGILAIMFVGIGLYATQNGTSFQAAVASLTGYVSGQPTIILTPQYGFFNCQPTSQTIVRNLPASFVNDGYGSEHYDLTVSVPGSAKQAQLGFHVNCNVNVFGQGSCPITATYVKINANGQPSTTQTWISNQLVPNTATGQDFIIPVTFNTGEKAQIKVSEFLGLVIDPTLAPVQGYAQYTPYQLVQQDATTRNTFVVNANGCTIPGYVAPLPIPSTTNDVVQPCVSGCTPSSGAPNGLQTTATFGSAVPFDQYSTYLGGFNLAPAEQAQTVNGQPGLCVGTGNGVAVQGMDTITTSSGSYYVPNPSKVLATGDCCPYMTAAGKTCVNNKWVLNSGGANQCDMFGTVNACQGAGNWVTDYTDNSGQKQIKATGCDSSNNCIFTSRIVQCTSNQQCSAGNVCNTQTYQCVSSGTAPVVLPTCGNNICEATLGETAATCQADCANPNLPLANPWAPLLAFLWLWLIGTIIAAIIIAVVAIFAPVGVLKVLIMRPMYLLGAAILFGLLIAVLFGIQIQPAANLAASLVQGGR